MSSKRTILCIDDEQDNVEALERLFRKKYNVLKATSGDQALKILKAEAEIAVIICDQRMPGMTGVEFFQKSLKLHPESVRILLTGYTDITSVIDAINSGEVYRYVTKPWDPVDLANTVDKGVERFDLGHELQKKNAELSAALDELKILDQTKTQFMMLINHELKTPLTSVISFLDLLAETKLNEEQKHFVSRVQKGSARLKEIVDDVLLLVSAEMGVLPVKLKNISGNDLLPQLPELLTTEMENKKLQLTTQMAAVKVHSDPSILHQVMQRILHNAVKFSKSGHDILVESETAGDQVIVKVVNHGEMDKKLIEKILTPFFINENMMNHSKGLGLGLSVSQALLRRLGSSLDIKATGKQVQVSFALDKA